MRDTAPQPTQALETIGAAVRKDVRFDGRYGLGEHPARGNCHVFVDRAASLHQETPGSHYVAYCYDHAFNIGTNEDGMYAMSADMREFSISEGQTPEIRTLLSKVTNEAIASGLIVGSVAGFANITALERCFTGQQIEEIGRQNPWFTQHWLRASQPAMTIMELPFAREAFENYWQLKKGLGKVARLENSDVESAIDFEAIRVALEGLRIRTPQHETRPQYNEALGDFEKAIRFMARNAIVSASDLEHLVTSYEETLPETNTSANVLFGDCFRHIGKKMGSRHALEEAGKRYDKASRYSRSQRGRRSQLVVRKAQKLRQESARLAGAS